MKRLFNKCGVSTTVNNVKTDPADRYLNKIMANSVWQKWAQNPSSQQELCICGTIRSYHDLLHTGHAKRVTLDSKKLLQVEMKCDRSIDGENREKENSRSGLEGRNTIMGAFVTAAASE